MGSMALGWGTEISFFFLFCKHWHKFIQIIMNWGNLMVDEEAKGSNKDVASLAGV